MILWPYLELFLSQNLQKLTEYSRLFQFDYLMHKIIPNF